jgi:hypothetical protein
MLRFVLGLIDLGLILAVLAAAADRVRAWRARRLLLKVALQRIDSALGLSHPESLKRWLRI